MTVTQSQQMNVEPVMNLLLAAAGWDAGSLRHKQLQSALDAAHLAIVPASGDVRAAVIEALGQITDLTVALRQGGPDPDDLQELSEALETATSGAYDARAALSQAPATPLDQAWEAINALGGRSDQNNSYDQGIVDTVSKVLEIVEALGGKDPKQRGAVA